MTCEKVCAQCGRTFYRDKRCTWKHWASAKFCSRACSSARHSDLAQARRPSMEEKFFSQVKKSEGCWEWLGSRDKDGYGLFPYAGKLWRAPVASLQIAGRPVSSENPIACHTCDWPPCVNPDHLYPGTHAMNMRDAVDRKRTRAGSSCHFAKLTEGDVFSIREMAGTDTETALAFSIARATVSLIRGNKTWRHIL